MMPLVPLAMLAGSVTVSSRPMTKTGRMLTTENAGFFSAMNFSVAWWARALEAT